MLTVLLEYINLFNLSGSLKQRGAAVLYHSTLEVFGSLHTMLSIIIIIK